MCVPFRTNDLGFMCQMWLFGGNIIEELDDPGIKISDSATRCVLSHNEFLIHCVEWQWVSIKDFKIGFSSAMSCDTCQKLPIIVTRA